MHLFFTVSVVTQAFKVDVEVIGAARGCTAVLKCVVPSFVKDLVRIMSWVQEPSNFIYASLQGGTLDAFQRNSSMPRLLLSATSSASLKPPTGFHCVNKHKEIE